MEDDDQVEAAEKDKAIIIQELRQDHEDWDKYKEECANHPQKDWDHWQSLAPRPSEEEQASIRESWGQSLVLTVEDKRKIWFKRLMTKKASFKPPTTQALPDGKRKWDWVNDCWKGQWDGESTSSSSKKARGE